MPALDVLLKMNTKTIMHTIVGMTSWGVAIYFFTIVAPWTTAVEVHELDARYAAEAKTSWKAALIEHGKVKEWKRGTIHANPFGFWTSVAAMLSAASITLAMAVLDSKQRQNKSWDATGDNPSS